MENFKTILSNKRLLGFFLMLATLGSLSLLRTVFTRLGVGPASTISYVVSAALALMVLLGLGSEKYKSYAQGAIVG